MNNVLAYNPDTGHLTWKVRRNGRVKAGAIAGTVDKLGYVVVRYDFVQYGAHRIAWLLTHGAWPQGDIDHINGNRSDNRLCNLRDVSRAVNLHNQKRAHRDSTTGYLGVSMRGKLFQAQIMRHGKRTHIGFFNSPLEASAAYQSAKQNMDSV